MSAAVDFALSRGAAHRRADCPVKPLVDPATSGHRGLSL